MSDIIPHLSIFVIANWLIGITSLSAGIFILKNGKAKRLVYFGGVMLVFHGMTFLLGAINASPIHEDIFTITYRLSWVTTILGIACLYFAMYFLRLDHTQTQSNSITQSVHTILVSVLGVLIFLIIASNIFYDGDFAWSAPSQTWIIEKYAASGLLELTKFLLCVGVIYHIYGLIQRKRIQEESPRQYRLVLFASYLFAFSIGFFGMVNFLVGIGALEAETSRFLILNILAIISVYFLIVGITRNNLFIREGAPLVTSFFVHFGSTLIITAIYGACTLFIIADQMREDFYDHTIFFISIIFALSMGSHALFPFLQRFLLQLLHRPQKKLSLITREQIQFTLRAYNTISQLNESPLLALACVQQVADKKQISKAEALRYIIDTILEDMRPQDEKIRSKPRIMYEIVRMIAYDQALEGQILWALGFDASGSEIASDDTPKFALDSNSEYKATSKRSYHRLRQEALQSVQEALLRREKKVLRL